jgi:hypothetical protein
MCSLLSLASSLTRDLIDKRGGQSRKVRETDKKRLISAGLCFRRIAVFTPLDHKRNKEIIAEQQISQITEFMDNTEDILKSILTG